MNGELDYEMVKGLGAVVTTMRASYRFWAMDVDVSGAEDPKAAIRAAHSWFKDIVDELKGPVEVENVRPAEESAMKPPRDDGTHDGDENERFETPIEKYKLIRKDKKLALLLFPNADNDDNVLWHSPPKERILWDKLNNVGVFSDDVVGLPHVENVSWIVTWRYGNKKNDGTRWRNVLSLRRA